MATWPSTIHVTRDNYKETSPDRVTRSNMDVGPQKVRRRSSAAVRPVSLSLFLTDAELEIIEDFFDENDALVFDFTDPRTGDAKRARFTSPITAQRRETMWDVSVSLEYLP